MENASKALIIAGAILISIVLVSIGVIAIQSASGVTEQMTSQMDETEIRSFNAQWSSYQGNNQSASTVKSLVEKYKIALAQQTVNATSLPFTIGGTTVGNTYDASALSGRYNIAIGTNANTGMVNSITVTVAGTTATPVANPT